MNMRDIRTWEFTSKANAHRHDHSHTDHAHFWQSAMSRRQFARAVAGTAVVGAGLGAGLWRPGLAMAHGSHKHRSHEPIPIPGGFQAGGQTFHVLGPGLESNPPDQEPSTITDFNGFIGLAYLNGTVTQINTATGEERMLPFLESDMRFMKGVFRGTDGRIHHGAFALVWVDVYDPSLGPTPVQIHDMNPSILPSGLFWTIAIPSDGIQVHLGKGVASMEATDVPITDYGVFENALFGGGPAPIPGVVSFKVAWSGVDEQLHIRNEDPVFGGFAGKFIRNAAQMEWTASVGDFTFVSDPLATSSSVFAEIGRERNGFFFPLDDDDDD